MLVYPHVLFTGPGIDNVAINKQNSVYRSQIYVMHFSTENNLADN